jgi:prevent-host-death family protein
MGRASIGLDLQPLAGSLRTKFGTRIGAMRASDVKPITYMKTHSAELVADVNKRRSPVVITQNGKPRAVVVDIETYERTQDALMLLKLIAQSEEDLRKGKWLSQSQMEAELRKRLGD